MGEVQICKFHETGDRFSCGYRGTSCTINRNLRKRTGFDPCVFLIQEKSTDRILPPFSEFKKTSDWPDFWVFLGLKTRPTGFCVCSTKKLESLTHPKNGASLQATCRGERGRRGIVFFRVLDLRKHRPTGSARGFLKFGKLRPDRPSSRSVLKAEVPQRLGVRTGEPRP